MLKWIWHDYESTWNNRIFIVNIYFPQNLLKATLTFNRHSDDVIAVSIQWHFRRILKVAAYLWIKPVNLHFWYHTPDDGAVQQFILYMELVLEPAEVDFHSRNKSTFWHIYPPLSEKLGSHLKPNVLSHLQPSQVCFGLDLNVNFTIKSLWPVTLSVI